MKIFIGYEDDGITRKFASNVDEIKACLLNSPMFKDHEGNWWCLPQDPSATVKHMCDLIAAQEAALKEVQKCHWWWPFGAISKARKIMSECEESHCVETGLTKENH